MTEEMNHQKNQLHSKQLVNSSFITGLEEKVVELVNFIFFFLQNFIPL